MGTVFATVSDHVQPSRRGSALGWVMTGQSLSLVLGVPLATLIGAQAGDPSAPNYDPGALETESPLYEVTLDPFFLAKHELTQGQWERFTGCRPKASVAVCSTCNACAKATRKPKSLRPPALPEARASV